MFSLFIDAYHTELKEEGKMKSISIFVLKEIDLKGYKDILGYWVRKEEKTQDSGQRFYKVLYQGD